MIQSFTPQKKWQWLENRKKQQKRFKKSKIGGGLNTPQQDRIPLNRTTKTFFASVSISVVI